MLEVGCGAMGWLRLLSRWVGETGEVVGTDVDDTMLDAARVLCAEESLTNVILERDDIFASALSEASFDLVHLRFQLAPLGRAIEQVTTARRLARPDGWIVLEEPDTGGWREHPLAPSAVHLRSLIAAAFTRSGGDFDAGRRLPEYLRTAGIDPTIDCACVALEPDHPYLQLPVQFATSLRPKLLSLAREVELDRLLDAAKAELADPERWGTTFTLFRHGGKSWRGREASAGCHPKRPLRV